MQFPAVLIFAIVWLLVGLPLSKLNKTAKQQTARKAGDTRTKQPEKQPAKQPDRKPAAAESGEGPSRTSVITPSVFVTEHDDSIYQGSMYAVTGEGYDPCHDEQLAGLTAAETAAPAAESAEPGLQLNWTGSEIVRGFVMSEILKRK